MQWYYAFQGKQVGPLPDADFQKLVEAGAITPSTLVWREGMADWTEYRMLGEPASSQQSPGAGQSAGVGKCCECGKEFPINDLVKYETSLVCAACKPLFFQRLQEGAALPGTFEYAGFWTRFGAKFVDGIVMGVVNVALSFLITGAAFGSAAMGNVHGVVASQILLMVVELSVGMAYYVFFHGKYGATPGKMACKIRVIRSDGSPITYGRALGRFFGDFLSGLTLSIGYVMAAFDDEKRALHDRICDTRVVRNS